jgi:BirA family biotin operon repressor/biotin-[acetyl-CoA-carboxylase] ligase
MSKFDVQSYLSHLQTDQLGRSIVTFPELGSTNSWLKSAPSADVCDGMICLADYQSMGRGQYERGWVSESGSNLTWSMMLQPGSPERLFLLTLTSIHAVANVIERELGLKASIKWPNDLMVLGKKVAGVLAEAIFNGNKLDRFIIGIGLNVNQSKFPEELPDASSLAMLSGRQIDRERLLADIINECEGMIQAWHSNDAKLPASINQRLIGYGSRVKVEVDGTLIDERLLLLGVNRSGHLHLLGDDYTVHTYAYEQVRIIVD